MIQHLANSIHFISLYKNINSEDIIYIKIKDKELVSQSFGEDYCKIFGDSISLTLKCPQDKGEILMNNMGLKIDEIHLEN
jgi:hypothetical protein